MYPWVTHTWNPIRGLCPHECSYCYVPSVRKRYGQKLHPLRLVESELKTNLGTGRTIFVGSTVDMFADAVCAAWISSVLEHCRSYPDNTYLFQSKNPQRFHEFEGAWPQDCLMGTTLESNYLSPSKAPAPYERAVAMMTLAGRKMVSIEPILDLDPEELVAWIRKIEPDFASIGADSKGHHLPEPDGEKVRRLLQGLETFTEVRAKDNLERLMR
jgi:protein gp37